MTWSCPVCTANRDHRRKCSARDCRYPGGPASAWQNSGKDTWNSKSASVPAMGRRWTCRACSYENYSWRAFCHSCNQAAESAGRGGNGGASTRRPAQRTTFSDVLSAECDRLRGGSEAPGADAMLVEEGAVAKSEEQERVKALDASIANLEKARGGKPDDAIDEVLRLKRQERQVPQVDQGSPQDGNWRAGKGGHQARGSAEGGGRPHTALASETAGDCGRKERCCREGAGGGDAAGETFGGSRLRRVCHSWLFCFALFAKVAAAVGSWTCCVAPRGRSGLVRGMVFQRRFRGQGFHGPLLGGFEPGVSSDPTRRGSCLADADYNEFFSFDFKLATLAFQIDVHPQLFLSASLSFSSYPQWEGATCSGTS